MNRSGSILRLDPVKGAIQPHFMQYLGKIAGQLLRLRGPLSGEHEVERFAADGVDERDLSALAELFGDVADDVTGAGSEVGGLGEQHLHLREGGGCHGLAQSASMI